MQARAQHQANTPNANDLNFFPQIHVFHGENAELFQGIFSRMHRRIMGENDDIDATDTQLRTNVDVKSFSKFIIELQNFNPPHFLICYVL